MNRKLIDRERKRKSSLKSIVEDDSAKETRRQRKRKSSFTDLTCEQVDARFEKSFLDEGSDIVVDEPNMELEAFGDMSNEEWDAIEFDDENLADEE